MADIKLDNLFLETFDERIFDDFVQEELEDPICRKVGATPVYGPRGLRTPGYGMCGHIVLGDFSHAVQETRSSRTMFSQPNTDTQRCRPTRAGVSSRRLECW